MNFDLTDTEFSINEGPLTNLARIGNIYISSHMTEEGIQYLHDLGICHFLDFKAKGEVSFDEPAFIAAAGGEYINAPVSTLDAIDSDFLKNIDTLLGLTDGPCVIYCISGNRIIAWLMLHLIKVNGYSEEEVYSYAKQFPFCREETRLAALSIAERL
ncbi:MAG: hypothetical protein KAG61_08590 [Bacteriovoracaceae bacterium]|nr:hypothetical protein [Bacteriovoracaceae bacterium]